MYFHGVSWYINSLPLVCFISLLRQYFISSTIVFPFSIAMILTHSTEEFYSKNMMIHIFIFMGIYTIHHWFIIFHFIFLFAWYWMSDSSNLQVRKNYIFTIVVVTLFARMLTHCDHSKINRSLWLHSQVVENFGSLFQTSLFQQPYDYKIVWSGVTGALLSIWH